MVIRDVQFHEDDQWVTNEESRVKNNNLQLDYDDLGDDQPIRETRSLYDIYERCNVAFLNLQDMRKQKWIKI